MADLTINHVISLDPALATALAQLFNLTQPPWATNVIAALQRIEARMATIDATLAALKADLDEVKTDLATASTGITTLQASVTSLNATIKDLQTQLANAGLSAAQQQALTDAVTEADAVKASADSLAASVAPPPAPAV